MELVKISKGNAERGLASCWIGDFEAFKAYQEVFHCMPEGPGNDYPKMFNTVSKMSGAFQVVVDGQRCASVGGFLTVVAAPPRGFEYHPYARAMYDQQNPALQQRIDSKEWTTIEFGSAALGGYAYSTYVPEDSGTGAIGIYFHQGRYGILIYPRRSWDAVHYSGVSQEEYIERVADDFGFTIWGIGIG